MIFFSHIPKTGGTTFRNILIDNYSYSHLDLYKAKHFKLLFKKHYYINKIKSVSGHSLHFDETVAHNLPNSKFVIFVRDPVERLVSFFFYINKQTNKEITFDEWLNKISYHNISNAQTRFIAGNDDVDKAKLILDKYFFVGKLEKFDESILLFRKMFLKKEHQNLSVFYKKKRVSKRNKLEIINNSKYKNIIKHLKEQNTNDIILNKYVTDTLFPRYFMEYGHIHNEELTYFRNVNSSYKFNRLKKIQFLLAKNCYYNILQRHL